MITLLVEYSWFEAFVFYCIKYIILLPLACKMSVAKADDSLVGFPLYVTFFLSLAAFKSLSLSLIFAILIIICLDVVFLGSLVLGDL